MINFKKIKFNREKLLVLVSCAIFFTIFTTIALHRYWQYASWYYDFGIFHQAIAAVSRLEAPTIDHFVFSGRHILGDHFHPLIFIISPIYALFKRGEVLHVVQTLFVASSGYFIYLTAKEILQHKLEAFSLLLIYFSFIGLQLALISEFHALTLLPLPLSIFFYGWAKQAKKPLLLGWILTLLVKETVFIIPAWFGLVMFFQGRRQKKAVWTKLGLLIGLGSIFYGVVIMKLVMPLFGEGQYYYLSDTLNQIAWAKLNLSQATPIIGKILSSYGLLPLLAPQVWPPIIFNLLSRLLRFGELELGMHYNAELAPTLILGSILGWRWLKSVFNKTSAWMLGLLALVLLGLNLLYFDSPVRLFFNNDFYQHTKNFQFLDQLLAQVPVEGTVMAQHNLAAKLAGRRAYILRDDYQQFSPDYIVLDTRGGQEPNNFLQIKDFAALTTKLATDSAYQVYYDQGEQLIYQKRK